MDQAQIKEAVRKLGISGKPVCIHSSLGSFGHLEGGAQSVIHAFIEEGCTILAPGFTYDFLAPPPPGQKPSRNGCSYEALAAECLGKDKIFRTDSCEITRRALGAVPAELVRMPGRVRGYHPINSLTAFGPMASQLVEGQNGTDIWDPFRVLYEKDGYVLLMGVDLTSATAIHYAEQLAGRRPFIRWANNPQGTVVPITVGSCSLGFEQLSGVLNPIETSLSVGQSDWRLFPLRAMVELCTNTIRRDPHRTHCKDPNCARCNDAEAGGPIL